MRRYSGAAQQFVNVVLIVKVYWSMPVIVQGVYGPVGLCHTVHEQKYAVAPAEVHQRCADRLQLVLCRFNISSFDVCQSSVDVMSNLPERR